MLWSVIEFGGKRQERKQERPEGPKPNRRVDGPSPSAKQPPLLQPLPLQHEASIPPWPGERNLFDEVDTNAVLSFDSVVVDTPVIRNGIVDADENMITYIAPNMVYTHTEDPGLVVLDSVLGSDTYACELPNSAVAVPDIEAIEKNTFAGLTQDPWQNVFTPSVVNTKNENAHTFVTETKRKQKQYIYMYVYI